MLLLREFGGWLMLAKKGKRPGLCRLCVALHAHGRCCRCERQSSPLLLCYFGLIDAFLGGDGVEMDQL